MSKSKGKQKLINKQKRVQKRKASLNAKKNKKIKRNKIIKASNIQFQSKVKDTKNKSDDTDNPQNNIIVSCFSSILNEYSVVETTSIFSSLLLHPEYQASQYRIEKAIYICLSFCQGNKQPDIRLIKLIFKKLEEFHFYTMEDPAEDVFIDTLWFENIQYKTCTGLWEGGIYQAQIFLNVIEDAPDLEKLNTLKKILKSVLRASDLIITNKKIEINTIGNEYPLEKIDFSLFENLSSLIESVKLIDLEDYEYLPSINIDKCSDIFKQEFGATSLEGFPFVNYQGNAILLLPSAITACIKRIVVSFIRDNYSNKMLDALFLEYQAKNLSKTKIFRAFEGIPIQFHKLQEVNDWGYFETLIEFDHGYFFHFIFISESLNFMGSDWFSGFSTADNTVENKINSSILKAKSKFISNTNGKRGCTFLVMCGYGKGMSLGLDYKSDETWMLESINAHDLATISNDTDCSPHKIWRIVESSHKLSQMGVKLINPNGFLNLYAYAKENKFSLVPHSSFQDSDTNLSNILIVLPSNSQLKLRQRVNKDTEQLSVMHPQQGIIRVIRGFADSIFENNERYNIYCPLKIDQSLLQVVYVNDMCNIWIEQKVSNKHDFSFQFQLFESALSWIDKIISEILEFGLIIPNRLLVWELSFDFHDDKNIKELPEIDDILNSFSNVFINSTLNSKFNTNLIDGLRLEYNYSEKALVLSILSFICEFNQNDDQINILNKIITSNSARHTHSFVAKKYREDFITDKEEPIYISQVDEQYIKLNLGWNFRDRSEGNEILGKSNCTKYLRQLVEYVWKKLQSKLKGINKEYLIEKLLVNIEKAEHQKSRWKRTFKANQALHGDLDELHSIAHNKISELNGASLSSRLLIEMAICECTLANSEPLGIIDIQELLCFASMMHHYGGISDAIQYEAIEPKLVLSTLGDVMFVHDFNDQILESYVSVLNHQTFSASAERYAEHLVESNPVESVSGLFESDFNNAWFGEFGFTIDETRVFIDHIEDYGCNIDKLVYRITVSELLALFDPKMLTVAKRIIQEFEIIPREIWNKIPSPFKPTDWQPWKFRRRYSLAFRPIVRITNTDLLISPQHFKTSFIYLLRSCHSAILDENHFTNTLMVKWIGQTRAKNGLAFNTKTAKKLHDVGLKVREEIKLTEVLSRKLEKDYGDIDVLAWDIDKKVVLVIECKDLEFAKNQSEIARQIFEFKGQLNSKGKQDRLLKHVKRMEVLKNNINALSNFTGINTGLVIKGFVVFSNTVPMIFDENRLHKDLIEFLTFEQINHIRNDGS